MSYEPQIQTAGGRGGGRKLPPRPVMTGGEPQYGGKYPMGWGKHKNHMPVYNDNDLPANPNQPTIWNARG